VSGIGFVKGEPASTGIMEEVGKGVMMRCGFRAGCLFRVLFGLDALVRFLLEAEGVNEVGVPVLISSKTVGVGFPRESVPVCAHATVRRNGSIQAIFFTFEACVSRPPLKPSFR
jgi:hypothetical protein